MKLFIICYLLTNVLGYGYKLHTYLGNLTDTYLQKNEIDIYNKINSILKGGNLALVSSWADKVKRQAKYSWSKELHYIDILECHKEHYGKDIVDKYCKNKCILSVIQDFANSLRWNSQYDYVTDNGITLSKDKLLMFLIHFFQDFFQPMHLLGYTRGGNSFPVKIFINNKTISSNLHYIWDSMLPEYFIENYSYGILQKNEISNKRLKTPLEYYNLLENFLNTSLNISCTIYPDSHYIIFKEYFDKHYFTRLFDNYQKLTITSFKYIFENDFY